LPFANRVVLVAVWLRNQKEIPDEMHTIRRIMRQLERWEPDKKYRIPLAFCLVRRGPHPAHYSLAMMEVR
jgi:hypothetical protein